MARNFRGLSETNDYLQRKNPGVSFWEQWTYLLWLNCDEHEWHTNWMNQTDGTGQDLQCTSRTCYGVIEEWVPSFFLSWMSKLLPTNLSFEIFFFIIMATTLWIWNRWNRFQMTGMLDKSNISVFFTSPKYTVDEVI